MTPCRNSLLSSKYFWKEPSWRGSEHTDDQNVELLQPVHFRTIYYSEFLQSLLILFIMYSLLTHGFVDLTFLQMPLPEFILCLLPCRHLLLDSKIVSILKNCHNQATLSAVQSIVQNTLASEEVAQQHTTYLQGIGFGGLWRFSSQFSQVPISSLVSGNWAIGGKKKSLGLSFLQANFFLILAKL